MSEFASLRGGGVTWEIPLSEPDFWNMYELLMGPAMLAEARQDVEDVKRWESEGGSER